VDAADIPPYPSAVPWRCVLIDHEGVRRVRLRRSRPTASATEIAEEVMAVIANRIYSEHDDPKMIANLLARCVVQVTRPAADGWPEAYGESHGSTWPVTTGNPAARPAVEDPGRVA
jgi:hypothetical protein